MNQKNYDKSRTPYGKLLARRIQVCWVYFCVIHFWPLFFQLCEKKFKQKKTRENRIRLIEYSCAEISGPSEMPLSFEKLIFSFSRKIKLMRVLDNQVLARTSDN